MSWDSYITNLTGGANSQITSAAIIGQAGGVWAASPGFQPTPEEASTIVQTLKSGVAGFAANGIKVCGDRYIFVRGDDEAQWATGKSRQGGGGGIVVALSVQALIVAKAKSDQSSLQNANAAVSGVCDYLRKSNY